MINRYLFVLSIFFLLAFIPPKKSSIDKAYFHFYKGKVANQEGQNKKAIKCFRKALDLEPENYQYLMALVKVYFETSHFDELHQTLSHSHADFSNEEDKLIFKFISGTAYACAGDHIQASRYLKQAEAVIDEVSYQDSIIISHLYNNLGCEKILYQPIEYTPSIDPHPHYSVSFKVFPQAVNYFHKALQYNPLNFVARQNLDFSRQFCDEGEIYQDSMKIVRKSKRCNIKQLINDQTITTTIKDKLPQYQFKYLPGKMGMVINELNKYDEVVILLDNSGSMDDEISVRNVKGTRFNIVIDLAKYVSTNLKNEIDIGAVSVGADCDTYPELYYPTGEISREELISRINMLQVGGYTPLNSALMGAPHLFSDSAVSKAILLCTDGVNSCGDGNTCDIAESLYAKGINIFILSFLLESYNQEEYSVFDCMANISGGQIYEVETNSGVSNKTTHIEMPYYSLKLPVNDFDSCFCTNFPRIKYPVHSKPTY